MHFAFRTDASLHIGTGHVMRCLTLADALRERGAHSTFICRPHVGHLLDLIQQRGHTAKALASVDETFTAPADPCHAQWLGTDWASDAQQTQQALGDQVVDWLVVDHYALDAQWERRLARHYRKLMVIDDLADRYHACDLLLDQTFGRDAADYRPLVPADCRLLCGSNYALLRPEFAALRPYSLQRRARPALRELLITMGGVDMHNATGQVLQALRTCHLPADCRITVVLGATAPWLDEVKRLAQDMPLPTRVRVGISDMAQLMADSDLAIGAAGATSWERCCLGLPSIVLNAAENQRFILSQLKLVKAAVAINLTNEKLESTLSRLIEKFREPKNLSKMTKIAAAVSDGMGAQRAGDCLNEG